MLFFNVNNQTRWLYTNLPLFCVLQKNTLQYHQPCQVANAAVNSTFAALHKNQLSVWMCIKHQHIEMCWMRQINKGWHSCICNHSKRNSLLLPIGIMQRHYLQWAYSIMALACYLHAILLTLPALHSFQHCLTFAPVPTIVSYNVNQCICHFLRFSKPSATLFNIRFFFTFKQDYVSKIRTISNSMHVHHQQISYQFGAKLPSPGTCTDSDRRGRKRAVLRFKALQSLIYLHLIFFIVLAS